jgi:hypothetical protein
MGLGVSGLAPGSAQSGDEIRPSPDAELLEDVRRVGLDGPPGYVQLLSDFGVAAPAGGERSDPSLGRGQRLHSGQCAASRPSTGRAQFVPGPSGQQPHTAVIGQRQRPAQRAARGGAAVRPAQRRTEIHQRPAVLKPCRTAGEQEDRLFEKRDRLVPVGRGREGAQAGAARPGQSDPAGQPLARVPVGFGRSGRRLRRLDSAGSWSRPSRRCRTSPPTSGAAGWRDVPPRRGWTSPDVPEDHGP